MSKVRDQEDCVDLIARFGDLDGERAAAETAACFVTEKPEGPTPNPYKMLMCPFGILRRFKNVEFVGRLPREYTDDLTKKMLGDTLAFDVPSMFFSLQNWVYQSDKKCFPKRMEYTWTDSMSEAESASFEMDVEDLRRVRK